MGGGSSVSYKIVDGSTTGLITKCDWLADLTTRLVPINQDAFINKKATG